MQQMWLDHFKCCADFRSRRRNDQNAGLLSNLIFILARIFWHRGHILN